MNKKNILILFLLVFPVFLFSQVKDAAIWANIDLEKKITEKFAIQVSENIRLNENITEIGTVFTQVSADYKILKGLKLGAAYRFSQRKQVDDFYSLRHRYAINLTYKLKIKKISFAIRAQFQSQYKNIYSSETGKTPSNYLRRKLTVKYDLEKKYTPFISIESWSRLNNAEGNEIDNLRYQIGFDYEINKFSSITASYIINQQIHVNSTWTSYITNIGYSYSF